MTPASKPTAPSAPRLRLILSIGVVLIALTGFLVAAWIFRPQSARTQIQIAPNVTLKLVEVLTKDDPQFTVEVPPNIFRNLLPDFVNAYFSLPAPTTVSYQQTYGLNEGAIALVFKAEYPAEWNASKNTVESKIRKAIETAEIKNIRLKYGDGFYSQETPFLSDRFQVEAGGIHAYYSVTAYNVPSVVEQLTFEMTDSFDPNAKVIKSFTIRNPLFENIPPITNTVSLPATVTVDNVGLTLHKLVTNAAGANPSLGYWEQTKQELKESGKFLRAAGTADDPYYTNITWKIAQPDTPDWTVFRTRFFYGTKKMPFGPMRSYGPVKLDNNQQLSSHSTDVGLLNQPVFVSTELIRQSNYPPDEMQTIDITLPTTGTDSGFHDITGLWDGKLQVSISNNTDIKIPNKNHPMMAREGYIQIVLFDDEKPGNSHYRISTCRITEGKLKSPDETVDITKRISMHFMASNYRIADLKYDDTKFTDQVLPPVDLTEFTTLSLTIASPRIIGPFEYAVQPTKASGPIAKPNAKETP